MSARSKVRTRQPHRGTCTIRPRPASWRNAWRIAVRPDAESLCGGLFAQVVPCSPQAHADDFGGQIALEIDRPPGRVNLSRNAIVFAPHGPWARSIHVETAITLSNQNAPGQQAPDRLAHRSRADAVMLRERMQRQGRRQNLIRPDPPGQIALDVLADRRRHGPLPE